MKINERFRVISDKCNYIIEEMKPVLTKREKGKEQTVDRYEWKEIAYCSTTDGVVRYLTDIVNRECLSGAETLEEWNKLYNESVESFSNIEWKVKGCQE